MFVFYIIYCYNKYIGYFRSMVIMWLFECFVLKNKKYVVSVFDMDMLIVLKFKW